MFAWPPVIRATAEALPFAPLLDMDRCGIFSAAGHQGGQVAIIRTEEFADLFDIAFATVGDLSAGPFHQIRLGQILQHICDCLHCSLSLTWLPHAFTLPHDYLPPNLSPCRSAGISGGGYWVFRG